VNDQLEQRLYALGAALDVPAAPNLASAVIGRLPDRRRARARPARRTGLLAFGVGLLLAGTAMAVPPTRDAILNVLGLRGVRIERVTSLPASAGARLGLGTRIPLAAARHAADFTALEPPGATAAFLAHDMPGGRISLLVGRTLVTEFRASVSQIMLKMIGADTRDRRVGVNRGPGVYLYGAPHEVLVLEPNGVVRSDRIRLAGNVLLWQQGPLTVRIEGTHTLAQALALAHSLR
jgi:hypothetical protein